VPPVSIQGEAHVQDSDHHYLLLPHYLRLSVLLSFQQRDRGRRNQEAA
jgi:hypothetical protein